MNLVDFVAIGLPTSLVLIMLAMGLTLNWQDFTRVAIEPRAFAVGLAAQMIAVPLLAFSLLQFFDLSVYLAVGLLILSYSPGGTTSNLFSYLAKGDVPLSISLTVAASVITPFSIPLLSEITLHTMLGESRDISIPFGMTAARLVVVTVIPLGFGMLIKHKQSRIANTLHFWVHRISMLLFFSVIGVMIFNLRADLSELLREVGAVTLLMVSLAMLCGYTLSKYFRLGSKSCKTITIEVGMQNGAMALIVTQGILQNATMSLVPIIYGLLMLLPIGAYILLNRNENTHSI